MMSRPNRSAKFGNERWYVTIFVPLYGAIWAVHFFTASVSRALKAASRCSKYARSAGLNCESLSQIDFAMTRPFSGSSQ